MLKRIHLSEGRLNLIDVRFLHQPAAEKIVAAFDAAGVGAADVAAAVAVARLSERSRPSARRRCAPAASPKRTRPRRLPAVAPGHQTFPAAASVETLPEACRALGHLKNVTNMCMYAEHLPETPQNKN